VIAATRTAGAPSRCMMRGSRSMPRSPRSIDLRAASIAAQHRSPSRSDDTIDIRRSVLCAPDRASNRDRA
jgi:hypothetical protein